MAPRKNRWGFFFEDRLDWQPATPAVESARVWKAPDPRLPPRTFPHPLEIPLPGPAILRDSHSYTQPRRRDLFPGKGEKIRRREYAC